MVGNCVVYSDWKCREVIKDLINESLVKWRIKL